MLPQMESSKKANYLKSGMWYMIGNILVRGISFFALPIFTRLLTSEDFGKFNIFLAYENILYIILGLGFGGTIKTAFFDYKERFLEYFSAIISLTVIFTLVVDAITNLLLLVLFSGAITEFWNIGIINLLIFQSSATALYTLISTKYVIEEKYKYNIAMSLFYALASILLSVILCYTFFSSERYLARIVGNAIPLVVMAYIVCIAAILRAKVVMHKEYWKYALKMGLPLILHLLSMVLLQQIGKLMVNYFYGDSITGIYSLAVTITTILTVVLSSFDNAWAPWFYKALHEQRYEDLIKGNNKFSLLFAFVTSGFLLISPELIKMTSTSEYYTSIHSLIPLIIAVFVNFMYLFAVNQEYYCKMTRTISIGTIIATAFGVTLNYFFIPIFGYTVAAYIDLFCKLILFIVHTLIVSYLIKNRVVSLKVLLGLLVGVSVIGAITLICKDLYIVRYSVVVILCLLAVKPLIKVIKTWRSITGDIK